MEPQTLQWQNVAETSSYHFVEGKSGTSFSHFTAEESLTTTPYLSRLPIESSHAILVYKIYIIQKNKHARTYLKFHKYYLLYQILLEYNE